MMETKKCEVTRENSPGKQAICEWTDTSIERHDLYNFEAKLEYNYHENSPYNDFSLAIYFFIPQALQITEKTYPKERFYADCHAHIRFKTPKMALSGILNEKNNLSPLFVIYANLESIKNGKNDSLIMDKIIYELRLLGSILKSTLRDQIRHFINQRSQEVDEEDLNLEFNKYLNEVELLQNKMRYLGQEFLVAQIPPKIRECFNYTDEFMSLQITDHIVEALKAFQNDPAYRPLCDRFVKIIEHEQKHRKAMNSHLLRKRDSDNELYTYYEGILKKYLQSVLYLNSKDKNEESRSLQLFYSIAAGLAMFVSLGLGFIWASQYPANSLPYIFAIVISYMIKDRLKAMVQTWSNRFVRFIFPDKKYDILDQHHRRIGTVQELVRYPKWKDMPPEILNIRSASNRDTIEQEGKPETIIKYMKEVRLYTEPIAKLHDRFGDINDIIRFNIRQFIQYADDPERYEAVWNMDTKQVDDIMCAKVYHVNLIIKLRAKDQAGHDFVSYRKVRVVLDQRGIKQIQEVKFAM